MLLAFDIAIYSVAVFMILKRRDDDPIALNLRNDRP